MVLREHRRIPDNWLVWMVAEADDSRVGGAANSDLGAEGLVSWPRPANRLVSAVRPSVIGRHRGMTYLSDVGQGDGRRRGAAAGGEVVERGQTVVRGWPNGYRRGCGRSIGAIVERLFRPEPVLPGRRREAAVRAPKGSGIAGTGRGSLAAWGEG